MISPPRAAGTPAGRSRGPRGPRITRRCSPRSSLLSHAGWLVAYPLAFVIDGRVVTQRDGGDVSIRDKIRGGPRGLQQPSQDQRVHRFLHGHEHDVQGEPFIHEGERHRDAQRMLEDTFVGCQAQETG